MFIFMLNANTHTMNLFLPPSNARVKLLYLLFALHLGDGATTSCRYANDMPPCHFAIRPCNVYLLLNNNRRISAFCWRNDALTRLCLSNNAKFYQRGYSVSDYVTVVHSARWHNICYTPPHTDTLTLTHLSSVPTPPVRAQHWFMRRRTSDARVLLIPG